MDLTPLHDKSAPANTGKRMVRKTEKARALEENTDSDDSGPGKNAQKRKEKKRRIKAIPEGDDSSEDGEDDAGGKIDWKDTSLTWALITAITDDPIIKQGLFPSPGANVSTAKGGGKPKTDHHHAVALAIFGEHEAYRDAFKLATGPKDKAVWGKKIKNRIQILVKKTREHLKAMGETGAGITSEDQINMDEENEFMNKWKLIKNTFPWLWEMKDLISERPNVTPVGLGNSDSTIDMSGYDAGYKTDGDDSKPATEIEEEDDDVEENDEDDKDKVTIWTIPRKRLARSANKKEVMEPSPLRKTKALKSELNRDKKSKVLDRFVEIASVEEVTNQKSLDLKKVQSQNAIAKIKAKAEVQIHRNKLKAELRMLEKRQEHDYCMAQLNLQIAQAQGTSSLSSHYYASPNTSGLYNKEECSQSSRSFSTGPSTGFDFDGFDYDTSLSGSTHLPTLPAPDNFESN